MDFHYIPQKTQPAYAWLWNSTITREGIDRQIDEMQKNGIGAFYIIAEPSNWFPEGRATHLYPEYLSDEYLDLLFYAFEKANERGMYTWLYNEGAFPSGAACGLVTKEHPELAYKYFLDRKFLLKQDEVYRPHQRVIAAFVDDKRIKEGFVARADTEVREYYWDCNGTHRLSLRVDNAERRGSEEFLKITHEKLKKRFGEHMGNEISYMFDDESFMGGWSKDFEKIFYKRYGYDITDFMPYLSSTQRPPDIEPVTDAQYRAASDYVMLCGDLIRENYFLLMRDWLRKTNMQSVGHLDNDDKAHGAYLMNYGNVLETMRAFDVPGIDVIWSQIAYPENGSCCHESMEMFPRIASSAARQIGKNVALSESMAVYGAHVTPDLMRFVVNFQAVRGINLFNFMVVSYDRKTPMRHQYRPNYLGDNVGMDCLKQINDYTARLSNIMQMGRAEIKTALYYPLRTICAGGAKGRAASERFVEIGKMLESSGVSFDFIDEDLVRNATVKDGKLVCEFVEYENVFVASGDLEKCDVMEKLSLLKAEIHPDIKRNSPLLQSRKIVFEDGSEGYFLFNQGNDELCETVEITSDKHLYEVDLFSGEVYAIPHTKMQNSISVDISLIRGEGKFLLAQSEQDAANKPSWEKVCEIADVNSCISRIYKLDEENGVCNLYPEPVWKKGLTKWADDFSGEMTYVCKIPVLDNGEYRLNLGCVRHVAKVYIDNVKIGECTLYPYALKLPDIKGGEELKIVVANTPANECARSDYFDKFPLTDVGPYHKNMVIAERKETAGGLLGPIVIEKKVND